MTPDGTGLMTYDRQGDIRLYSTETWETLAEADSPDDRIPLQWTAPMAVSPDGELIAAGPSGVTRDPQLLLDAESLEPAQVQLEGIPTGPVRVIDVDFSADGSTVAATIQRLERQSGYWWPVATELFVWELAASQSGTAAV